MAKKRYSLIIRGHQHEWNFEVMVDPQYVEEWRADGIEIYPLCYSIPVWVVDLGLLRAWTFLQDVFHFRNPIRKNPFR